jgi:trehalose 6-phosphate phosphatase
MSSILSRRNLPVLERLAWSKALLAFDFDGTLAPIEDKAYSIAVHDRRSRAKKLARAAIVEAASQLGAVRIIGGKQVVNVLPKGAPHKGIARERERLGCDTATYVGDDETDEDVFSLDQPGRLLTIRVGAKRTSLAAHSLRNQRQIDDLLLALLRLRGAHAAARTGAP